MNHFVQWNHFIVFVEVEVTVQSRNMSGLKLWPVDPSCGYCMIAAVGLSFISEYRGKLGECNDSKAANCPDKRISVIV